MKAVDELTPTIGMRPSCGVVGISPATVYRHRSPRLPKPKPARSRSHRALSEPERDAVLDQLHSDRFVDWSPGAVHAALLDEGRYLASERTMYRLLAGQDEVSERRRQLTHPNYARPELIAAAPNEVWSWDITKLKGPHNWNCFHAYVIIDIFSRYCVGWTVKERESAQVAQALIKHAATTQKIEQGKLTVHADRGSSMRSKPVAFLLADLGITKSHSRPYTSTDNPFSEAMFKTTKYRPEFPDRFETLQDATAFFRQFIDWYNNQHRHSGIGMMTPDAMHSGKAPEIRRKRAAVLEAAYRANPERFVNGLPVPHKLPTAVWINKPEEAEIVS